jgi:UDP-2,3-diacylglucosamine pyrophosphatase LpxH
VVEFNQDVIDLFEKYIRPQFITHKKLEIIHGDAFDYYKAEFLKQFDYVYVDFWIEDSMLYDVKCIVAPYLYTFYQGKSVVDFISSMDVDSKMFAKKANKYFKTRNDVIKTEDQLLSIIHGKDILREIMAQ